jgi:4-hydroxy-2-oxoheptanedioate aldolase
MSLDEYVQAHAADRRPSMRERLDGPRPLFGTWVKQDAGDVIETLGSAGFDYIVLDGEHGEFDLGALPDLIRAIDVTGAGSLVRTAYSSPKEILRALDAGAQGIMVPNIESADQARVACNAARYAPTGTRGASPTARSARYGLTPFADHRAWSDAEILVVLQVEGPRGITNLDEILDVPGVDVVFIGPFDLATHLGVPGEVGHEHVVEAMTAIIGRARERGIHVSTWMPTPEQALPWLQLGVKLMTISNATLIFTEAARAMIDRVRALAAG